MLRPTDVARRLNVHRNTVYRWIESGHLPAFQLGGARYAIRIDERELDRWLHEQGRGPAVTVAICTPSDKETDAGP